jgi:hypothetical protein
MCGQECVDVHSLKSSVLSHLCHSHSYHPSGLTLAQLDSGRVSEAVEDIEEQMGQMGRESHKAVSGMNSTAVSGFMNFTTGLSDEESTAASVAEANGLVVVKGCVKSNHHLKQSIQMIQLWPC